jgi:hypothetical protein
MENLKDALATVINIAEKTDEALQDGKVSISEGVGIAFSAIGLIKVIKNIKSLFAEYKELTEDQRTELSEWFAENFDLVDDNLEVIIENIFAVLVQLGDVLDSLKK